MTFLKLLHTFFSIVVIRRKSTQYLQSVELYDVKLSHTLTHSIFLRPSDYFIFYEIFFLDIYRPLINQTASKGSILDLGGHVGLATLFIRAYKSNPIHVYEPSSTNATLLEKNIAGLPNITLYKKAVSTENGSATIHIYDSIPSRNSLRPETGTLSTTPEIVPTQTVDTILNSIPDLAGVKFDIEGLEYDAFSASQKRYDIPYLIGEIKLSGEFSLEKFLALFPTHKSSVLPLGNHTFIIELEQN